MPRLEVRFRKRLVDSRGSLPARSFARMERKNKVRTSAPAMIRISISQRLLSAARMPITTSTRPRADRIAPVVSNGRVGSGGSGSLIFRLSQTITAITRAWKMKAARQLMAEVMRPPIRGPAAAPTPPSALITPNARAREVISVNSSVVRM
jgi:hypothetical protein